MDDWEPITISTIAHARYCMRRAALLINENIWSENADTAKGRIEHERVHSRRIERRGTEIKIFECDVYSESLGVTGKCDCIEASAHDHGCRVPGIAFPVRLYPIEYKHGKARSEEEYELQLCAQAMCLEEMHQTSIHDGAVFYISSHKRIPVFFTHEMRSKVRETILAIDSMRREFRVPPATYGAKCEKCSMQGLCMPKVKNSAKDYCRLLRAEASEV